jgi:colanic acid/amylovoran biosynthesis glycosyltransferase
LPVIASAIGAAAELVRDGSTGLSYTPGKAEALAERVRWMLAHPTQVERMQAAARREFIERYTAAANYQMLVDIYRSVLPDDSRTAR